MLGDDIFKELLSTNAIVFARHDKWFAYMGNGGGLCYFSVGSGEPESSKGPNPAHANFKPLDEALDDAISATLPKTNFQNKSVLTNLLSGKVIGTQLEELGGSRVHSRLRLHF